MVRPNPLFQRTAGHTFFNLLFHFDVVDKRRAQLILTLRFIAATTVIDSRRPW